MNNGVSDLLSLSLELSQEIINEFKQIVNMLMVSKDLANINIFYLNCKILNKLTIIDNEIKHLHKFLHLNKESPW
jgi:hypothetical protein